MHSSEANRPAMIHQNISAEKVLIDHQFNPLISDSGLPKLLADDIVFWKEHSSGGHFASVECSDVLVKDFVEFCNLIRGDRRELLVKAGGM